MYTKFWFFSPSGIEVIITHTHTHLFLNTHTLTHTGFWISRNISKSLTKTCKRDPFLYSQQHISLPGGLLKIFSLKLLWLRAKSPQTGWGGLEYIFLWVTAFQGQRRIRGFSNKVLMKKASRMSGLGTQHLTLESLNPSRIPEGLLQKATSFLQACWNKLCAPFTIDLNGELPHLEVEKE